MSNNSLSVTKDTVLTKPKDLSDFLAKSKQAIELALPKHLNADRMLRLTLTCFSTTPKLRNCTAHSILASTVLASQLGLEVGVVGQGYLVPYGKTCTFVPGWQGLVGLLNNTGRATAWTGCVFEGDEFDFELGSNPKCRHIPGENYGDSDKITWVYAVGKVNGSEMPIVEAWPISRVLKHRDQYNKVGNNHYSFGNLEMYARKVVLLQVLKYLPRSIQVDNALMAANNFENGKLSKMEDGVVIDIEAATTEGTDALEKAAESAAETSARTRAPRSQGKASTPAPAAPSEPETAPEPEPEPTPAPAKEDPKPAPAKQEKPAPAKEEPKPSAAPAESAPVDERAKLASEVGEALRENKVSPLEFENACRRAGLLSSTENLKGATLEKVRSIHQATGGVIEAILAEKEDSPFQ